MEIIKTNSQGKLLRYILCTLMGASFVIFSCQQMVSYSVKYLMITCVVSFISGIFITNRVYDSMCSFIKENQDVALIILLIVVFCMYEGYTQKGISYSRLFEETGISLGFPKIAVSALNFFGFGYYIASIPSVWVLSALVFEIGKNFIKDIFENIEKREMKIYRLIAIVFMLVVFVVYLVQPSWYLQYDNVYSIDSGWCYGNIYPNLSYYDIRHPLLSELTFPIWAVIKCILQIGAPQNLVPELTGIFIQWINIWMLLLVGIMMRKMTNDVMVFYLYLCSFPTVLYIFSLEKYQMSVFLLVSYVYCKFRTRSESAGLFVLTAGVMPTNAFIGFIELLGNNSIKDKAKNIGRIIIYGLLVLVCFGRVHLINPINAYSEIIGMHSSFGTGSLSIFQRFIAVINLIESSFVALASSVNGEQYLWQSITEEITLCAVVLIVFLILGSFLGRKVIFYRVCTAWIFFAVILFVGLNWAPHESPLFAIIFSWAIIPLVVKGLNYVIEKLRINKLLIYASILTFMLSVNLAVIADISRFFG